MKKMMMMSLAGLMCMTLVSCGNMNQVLGAMTNGTGITIALFPMEQAF